MNLRKQLSSYIALNNYVEAIKSGQLQLPGGYTQLEYLGFTGTQYIDTQYVGNELCRASFVGVLTENYPISSIESWHTLFGSDNTVSARAFSFWVNDNQYGYGPVLSYDGQSLFNSIYVDVPVELNKLFTAELNQGHFTLFYNDAPNTNLYDYTMKIKSFTTPSSIILGALYRDGSLLRPYESLLIGNVYSFKMWDDNVLVRNLIPVKRNSDNVLGMYDTISETFFTNSGTGNFIAGPVYNSSIVLTDAITNGLTDLQLKGSEVKNKSEVFLDSVVAKGGTEQNGIPTPDTPLDIVCNNGVLKVGPNNSVIVEGTPETVTITGKNLFNESHIKSVAINNISVVIPVKQNKTYTWSYNKTEYDFRFDSEFIWGVDLNGSKVENGVTLVYANGTHMTASYVTVTVVSPNVVALQTVFRNNIIQSTKENVLASSMQLEEGIRPTKYEEYYQASFAPEDLLKLGDYQDVQSVLDGIVARNVGIKVLDGTENWTRYGTGKFATPLIGSKKQDNQQAPIGSHFIGMSTNNVPHTDGYVSVFNGSIAPTSGALGINYQATPELTQFKQWLADQYAAGTPVIVVYPLADTVEETVESRDVFITSGTNTIERSSEYVSSDGITVKYKKLR